MTTLAGFHASPIDPLLVEYARALNVAGHWIEVLDATFRVVFVSDELERSFAWVGKSRDTYLGTHFYSSEAVAGRGTPDPDRSRRETRADFIANFPELLHATPGGRDELRELVDPMLGDLVDSLPADEPRQAMSRRDQITQMWGYALGSWMTMLRVSGPSGETIGYLRIIKPAVGMSVLGTIGSGDIRHLERAQSVTAAGRRQAAIFFADLEASSPLARRLSTADYFHLARRLVRAADDCIVDAGGIVGRHVGDGVTAFFLAETLGSESAAARAAIEAVRAFRLQAHEVAVRHGLLPDDVIVRFGLHWGATLYVGLIKTVARTEVTALGDEVNEAARIEACATGGRALVSKALIERLDAGAVTSLDLGSVSYTALVDLPTATDKARRDAPSIAVCEV